MKRIVIASMLVLAMFVAAPVGTPLGPERAEAGYVYNCYGNSYHVHYYWYGVRKHVTQYISTGRLYHKYKVTDIRDAYAPWTRDYKDSWYEYVLKSQCR